MERIVSKKTTKVASRRTRRRARRPRQPRPMLPNTARTPGTIIKNFRKPNRISTHGNSYLHCRLAPFSAEGGTAIPDGANNNFFVSDARMVDNITLAGTNREFVIQTLPTLPYLAGIASTSGTLNTTVLNVNGVAVNAAQTYTPQIVADTRYYPISKVAQYAVAGAFPSPGLTYNDPYSSTTARMVSVGYKLTYTGPVTTCAGSITVTPNAVSLREGPQATIGSNPSTATDIALTAIGPSAVTNIFATAGTQMLYLDTNISPGTLTRESVVFRPEQTMLILPRHRTRDYKLRPTTNVPLMMVNAGPGKTLTPPQNFRSFITTTANTTNDATIIWYDDDWESITIYAQGLNADASFRWDTIVCMEYNPSITSVFSEMTIKSSPSQLAIMSAADSITAAQPVAVPDSGRPRNVHATDDPAVINQAIIDKLNALQPYRIPK